MTCAPDLLSRQSFSRHSDDGTTPRRPPRLTGSLLRSRPEVGHDSEGVDINAKVVNDSSELLDLLSGVELRLIADEVVQCNACGQRFDNELPEVEFVGHLDRGYLKAKAAGEDRLPCPVESGENHAPAPPG